MDIIITVKSGRAFTCDHPAQGYRALVEGDEVYVWDGIVSHQWTLVHSLTPAQIRYVRSQASRVALDRAARRQSEELQAQQDDRRAAEQRTPNGPTMPYIERDRAALAARIAARR